MVPGSTRRADAREERVREKRNLPLHLRKLVCNCEVCIRKQSSFFHHPGTASFMTPALLLLHCLLRLSCPVETPISEMRRRWWWWGRGEKKLLVLVGWRSAGTTLAYLVSSVA